MLNTILGVCVGLMFILGFYTGVRLGFRASKGKEPPAIKSPVRIVKEAVEKRAAEQAQRKENEAWEAFEANDGYTEEERAWMNRGDVNG